MSAHCDPVVARTFRKHLLQWWSEAGRHFLPWRNSVDPYHVFVAELLLQKTNAEKVLPVYNQVINRFPTICALASADVDEVRNILRPLGLHYRAARLKVAAQTILHQYGGQIPNTLEQLKGLDGIGDYIANAILCFAYRQPKPLVDTNSARVLGRVWGIPIAKRPRTDRALWDYASGLVSDDTPRKYNWALIDLAHLVCTARKPHHDECPLTQICVFYREEMMKNDRRDTRSK